MERLPQALTSNDDGQSWSATFDGVLVGSVELHRRLATTRLEDDRDVRGPVVREIDEADA